MIEESIRLEQSIALLYKVFSESLLEDHDFWWQLHLEEKSHANLIRSARDSFLKRGKFPYDLVAGSIEELKATNTKIASLVGHYKAKPPTRHEACTAAIDLENEAGESHYTLFMEKSAINIVETVFQQLNKDDINHCRRINDYLSALPVEA